LGLAVGLQAVARRIEQFGHQGAAHLVALRLQRLRQPSHALAGPPQRRFRIPAGRWFDQRLEIREQGRVLANRRLAPRPRPPNPRGWLILRQFLQTAPDRARRHAGRHRHRGNATISRGKCLRRRDQTTAPFIKKRRHRQKPLSNGLDIDHDHHIWYDDWVVNPCFTLLKVDSLISGRALSEASSCVLCASSPSMRAPILLATASNASARSISFWYPSVAVAMFWLVICCCS